MNAVRRHRIVLVEIERHDVPEAQAFFLVLPYELAVNADRRRARREAENGVGTRRVPFPDQRGDSVCNEERDFLVILDHDGADAFEPS